MNMMEKIKVPQFEINLSEWQGAGISEKDTKKTLNALEQIMTDVTKLSVPLVVESGVANNWGKAH